MQRVAIFIRIIYELLFHYSSVSNAAYGQHRKEWIEDASRSNRKEYSCPQTEPEAIFQRRVGYQISPHAVKVGMCAGFVSTECETVLYVREFGNKVYPLQLRKPVDMTVEPQGRRTNRRIDHFNYVLRALTQWEQIIFHTFQRVKYLAETLNLNTV